MSIIAPTTLAAPDAISQARGAPRWQFVPGGAVRLAPPRAVRLVVASSWAPSWMRMIAGKRAGCRLAFVTVVVLGTHVSIVSATAPGPPTSLASGPFS